VLDQIFVLIIKSEANKSIAAIYKIEFRSQQHVQPLSCSVKKLGERVLQEHLLALFSAMLTAHLRVWCVAK